jgi:Protein of unknown function (DUF3617)
MVFFTLQRKLETPMLGGRAISLAFSLSVAAVLPALAADNAPFKVKPGLWEVTSDSERSGALPIPPEALERMTPDQRAKLEAAMQQSMGPRHRVTKHCITQADIDKGFERMGEMDRAQCTRTVTASASTVRAGTFTCTGMENASGTYRFEAKSTESVVGTWNATLNNSGKTMTMKNALQGKWLGADCGDVKPRE